MELNYTSEETTDLNSPDPDISGFHIKGHKVLIRPIHVEGKTKGGIILSAKTHHDVSYLINIGKVLKIGPTAYTQEIFKDTGPWCKEGDYVLMPKLEGQKIKYKGVPLTIISCDRLIATLDNPSDIDPNFNLGV